MKTINVAKQEHVKLFNTIAIEFGARCNRRCLFCPNHKGSRPNEFMSEKMLDKIFYDLKDLKYKGRVTTYIYNEPLMDKRLLHLVKKYSIELPNVCFMVATNGDFFKSGKDIEKVFAAGVRQLQINVYSNYQRFAQISDWIDELDTAVNTEGSIYLYVGKQAKNVSIVDKSSVTQGQEAFNDGYKIQNRSGNIFWWKSKLNKPLSKMCVRPFRMLNINWKGDAILCCNDYYGVTNFGNVKTSSLLEIWNNSKLHLYRFFLQNKIRKGLKLCSTCDYDGGVYTHMVNHVTFGKGKDTKLLTDL